jgi:hypothetical protein
VLPVEKIISHFLTSLVASILGILIGGAVVFLFAHIPPTVSTKTQRLKLFIPWRTLVVGILEFFFHPLPILDILANIKFLRDIELTYSTVSVLGQVACLVVLFTPVYLFGKKPIQPTWTFLSWIFRSMATISVAMTTLTAGNVGVGFRLFSSMNNYDFSGAWFAWLITILICLTIDLIGGALQFSFENYTLFKRVTP